MCPPCKLFGPRFQRPAHRIQHQIAELGPRYLSALRRRSQPEQSDQEGQLEQLRSSLRRIHDVAHAYLPIRTYQRFPLERTTEAPSEGSQLRRQDHGQE